MENKKKYYGSIDGLRALSAFGIVVMHIRANGGYGVQGFVYNDLIAFFTNFVYLFMIVSAFGLSTGYYEKMINNNVNLEAFYGKRYAKILPFFSLLVCLDIVLSPSKEAIVEGIADVTLVFGLLPNAQINVIGVGWFLGTVFIFYFMFPFICYLMKSKFRIWLAFFVAIFYNLTCTYYFFDSNHIIKGTAGRHNILFSSMYFLAGCLIFLYKDQITKIFEKIYFILLVLFFGNVALYFMYADKNEFLKSMMILTMFCFLLIYAICGKSIILDNKVMKFISSVSLEVYLCHMLFFRVFEKAGLIKLFGNTWLSYLCTCVMVIGVAITFSYVVQRIFEMISKKFVKAER